MTWPPPVLAHITLSEWLGLAAFAASAVGWLWRTARKASRKLEQLLAAVTANSQQNAQLQRTTRSLDAKIEGVRAKTERIEREGSVPIREVLEAVRGQVVPKLEAVKAEQSRVATELTNGGEEHAGAGS